MEFNSFRNKDVNQPDDHDDNVDNGDNGSEDGNYDYGDGDDDASS